MWKENIWRKKRYFMWRKRRVEKEKEENIWRGKMSPWQNKQQTREDLDFVWVQIVLIEILLK